MPQMLAMQVVQKHPQRAARVAKRGPDNPRAVLGDEAAQYHRRQMNEVRDSDAFEVGGELA